MALIKVIISSHNEYKIILMEMIFENLNYMHWLVLGLALVIIELFLWSVFLLWIGASAITVSIIFYLAPSTSGAMQLLIFVLISISVTYLAMKYYPIKTVDNQLNNKAKSHIGKECEVMSIEDGIAKVQIGKSLWFAKGLDLNVGQIVQIVDVESSTFIVKPSKSRLQLKASSLYLDNPIPMGLSKYRLEAFS